MSEKQIKHIKYLLLGIFISLVIIALKPVPNIQIPRQNVNIPSNSFINLGNNKIGIVETNDNSGNYGKILIFQFDNKNNTFKLVGEFNYSDYYRNPQKYGLD
ncbi:hypothetical protein [Thermohalobacter berrensis]|uniref:Uncharacterized protein n=1 Tax=Thermohalobacter berrensis TaxID=99594 RepID=A0A419SXN3_9FIRM|nr:hypothetical protein [Thermohalobacter berrensis]RKD30020.1 hypothetical protein BET03_04765 [Thermohalobacter berrensis]